MKPATYTAAQMAAYEKRIGLPPSAKPIDPNSLEHLSLLQQLSLIHIPFTSLSLHYSPHHTLSLSPGDLFHKLVERELGGYCMENNGLFGIVLRTYGFKVVSFGGRVSYATQGRGGDGYDCFGHMVNVVTLSSTRYLVDVGFGVNGPTRPLPLLHDQPLPGAMSPTSQLRLTHVSLPEHTDPAQRAWVYSYRQVGANPSGHDAAADGVAWFNAYSFVETEFSPADWARINAAETALEEGYFVTNVLVQRALAAGEVEGGGRTGGVVGSLVLWRDEVRRKVGAGAQEVVERLGSEGERVRALERWFGFVLRREEVEGIRGLASELKG